MTGRGAASLLGLLLASVSLSCRQTQAPVRLRVAHGQLTSLDPILSEDSHTVSVLSNVYEGLVDFDREMALVPALATSWSAPDDHQWLVDLREGVRFHDGRVLTAADVKHSLERARDDPRSVLRARLSNLESVEVVGDRRLRLTTRRADVLLMNRLSLIFVVPAGSGDLAQHPIGTGPFKVVRHGDRRVEAAAFPDHWRGRPTVDEVSFVTVDSAKIGDAVRGREVDVLRHVPAASAAALGRVPGMRVIGRPSLSMTYLWMESRRPDSPFADRRVRRAVSLALDRAEVVRRVGGWGLPQDDIVPRGIFGHGLGAAGVPHDRDAVRALLAQAGKATGFEVPLTFVARSESSRLAAEAVRDMLAPVGMRVRLQEMPWPELQEQWRQARLPFFYATWRFENGDAATFLADTLRTPAAAAPEGSNPGYSNPELDEMIDTSLAVAAPGRRRVLYERMMTLVNAEVPLVPLYQRHALYAVSERVRWQPRLDERLIVCEMTVSEAPGAPSGP